MKASVVGGGLELCLSCDLIVAARNAKMALPEVRHNVVAVGGSWLCPTADIRSGNWAGITAMCERAMKSLKAASKRSM